MGTGMNMEVPAASREDVIQTVAGYRWTSDHKVIMVDGWEKNRVHPEELSKEQRHRIAGVLLAFPFYEIEAGCLLPYEWQGFEIAVLVAAQCKKKTSLTVVDHRSPAFRCDCIPGQTCFDIAEQSLIPDSADDDQVEQHNRILVLRKYFPTPEMALSNCAVKKILHAMLLLHR